MSSSTLAGICIIGVLYGESALCSESQRERISNEACVMWAEAINILKALTFSCKWNASQMVSYQFISQAISCLFLCRVSLFFFCRFAVCRSLLLHPSHFAPLSSLGGQNMWQERTKSREMPGLDSATYIKARKHPPSLRSYIHPHASRARLHFYFTQWSQTNPNIGSTQAFLPATSIPLFIYTLVGVAMFYSSHFHLVVGIFLTPLSLFSLLLVLPLILNFTVRDCLLRRAWTVVSGV